MEANLRDRAQSPISNFEAATRVHAAFDDAFYAKMGATGWNRTTRRVPLLKAVVALEFYLK
jgi:hypothetical protein